MTLRRLICKEIAYRKMDFVLGVLAVFVAVGCLVALWTLLQAHAGRLAELNAQKEKETADLMAVAQDDYRKMMKTMGYNVIILSAGEDLSQFWTNGFAAKLMPEEFVKRLCESEIATVQHLLPQLYERIPWPEQADCPCILIGVRGEVPHRHSNQKEPMLDPVEPGTMRMGHALASKLGLAAGAHVTLMGAEFTIAEVHEPQGNADDVSIWVHLAKAQELLGKPDKINAILALSCLCAKRDLERVTRDIAAVLPEAQVIHRIPEANIRLDARFRVAALSQETVEKEAAHHARLGSEREAFAMWLIPLTIMAATIWIGLLAWGNVRERRAEIGILRALGLRARQILAVFMAKAAVIGCLGAVMGCLAGYGLGLAWSAAEGVPLSASVVRSLFDGRLFALVVALAPLQACIASWLPALVAAQQDPAVILREE